MIKAASRRRPAPMSGARHSAALADAKDAHAVEEYRRADAPRHGAFFVPPRLRVERHRYQRAVCCAGVGVGEDSVMQARVAAPAVDLLADAPAMRAGGFFPMAAHVQSDEMTAA